MRNLEDQFTFISKVKYVVNDCPIDHQPHEYMLEIKYHTGLVVAEEWKGEAEQKTVTFSCPNVHKTFDVAVTIPKIKDAQCQSVWVISDTTSQTSDSTEKPVSGNGNDKGSSSVIDDEFKAWISGSAQTSRDYSKTMISTSTGAVAVFYAVLTFLGIGGGKTPLSSLPGYPVLGILPPIAFLVSAIFFVAAFQPHTKRLDTLGDFITFRNQRLQQVGNLTITGTIFFLLGVGLAIVAYMAVIVQ